MTILSQLWNGIAELPGIRRHMLTAMTEAVIRTSDGMSDWDDARLLLVSNELRWRARSGEALARFTPMAFALVREAAHRVYGMRHFPVQLRAGLVMFDGGVAEMETGEGKTLSALPPVFLRALFGEGSHVLTTNDYLAARDAGFATPILALLGLSVGYLSNSMPPEERRKSYACDVTYGTEKEMGFDFLRDRLQHQARKDWRGNSSGLPDVEHVFNVLGTMESCPTYLCSSPKRQSSRSQKEAVVSSQQSSMPSKVLFSARAEEEEARLRCTAPTLCFEADLLPKAPLAWKSRILARVACFSAISSARSLSFPTLQSFDSPLF